jgi:hypothetical protein
MGCKKPLFGEMIGMCFGIVKIGEVDFAAILGCFRAMFAERRAINFCCQTKLLVVA